MTEAGVSPTLLERFAGARPPAAPWFREALACEPERTSFTLEGVEIELLCWGEVGKPGLLFLHGGVAHADWWSFIAPFFAGAYRCAAISWSGMGGSGWRESYSIPQYSREVLRAIEVAQLDVAGPPILIGHSFGGYPLMYTASHHGERIGGAIMIDSFVPREKRKRAMRPTVGRLYASLEEGLSRFRFLPEQSSDWPEIVDFIARKSLRQVPGDGEAPGGWSWRFDPDFTQKVEPVNADEWIERMAVPMALLYGERSAMVDAEAIGRMAQRLPRCIATAAIPEAQHHIMADQPLALVAALRLAISAITLCDNATISGSMHEQP